MVPRAPKIFALKQASLHLASGSVVIIAGSGLVLTAAASDIRDMSLPPDQMLSAKPQLSAEERRRRTADRLTMIR